MATQSSGTRSDSLCSTKPPFHSLECKHTVTNARTSVGTVPLMSCPIDLKTVAFSHFCLNFKCWESHPPLLRSPPPLPLSFLLKPTAPSIGVPVLHGGVCRRWRVNTVALERIQLNAVITIPASRELFHVSCKWKRVAENNLHCKWREWVKTCLQYLQCGAKRNKCFLAVTFNP